MLVKLTKKGKIMCTVNIYDIKTNFSKYVEMLEKGDEKEIVVCRYDKKIAKIVPYKNENTKKICGCGKNILPDFDFEDLKKGFEDIPELFGY